MPNFLSKKIDSAKQLEEAQKTAKARNSSAEMTAAAKKRGFKTADEMAEYEGQKKMQAGGTATKKAPAGVGNALSIHPAKLLDYVSERVKRATGNK